MKTRFFFAAMLLLAFGSVKAQENENPQVQAIQLEGSGDVLINQTQDKFSLVRNDENISHYEVVNGTLILSQRSLSFTIMPLRPSRSARG